MLYSVASCFCFCADFCLCMQSFFLAVLPTFCFVDSFWMLFTSNLAKLPKMTGEREVLEEQELSITRESFERYSPQYYKSHFFFFSFFHCHGMG